LDEDEQEVGVGVKKKKKEMKPNKLAEGIVVGEVEDEVNFEGDWSDGGQELPKRTLMYHAHRWVYFREIRS
jgi:hypothetical protein